MMKSYKIKIYWLDLNHRLNDPANPIISDNICFMIRSLQMVTNEKNSDAFKRLIFKKCLYLITVRTVVRRQELKIASSSTITLYNSS